MNIEDVRDNMTAKAGGSSSHWQVMVSILLSGALICALASIFVSQPGRLAIAALVLLGLGLFCNQAIERRSRRA